MYPSLRRVYNNTGSISYYSGDTLLQTINSDFIPGRTYYYVKKKKEINIIKSKDPSDCIICLEVCSENDSFKLDCACKFSCHKECIEKWLSIKQTCPFCKI